MIAARQFLLPMGEKVGPKGSDEGGGAVSLIVGGLAFGNSPLIRLAPRATFSPEGRR